MTDYPTAPARPPLTLPPGMPTKYQKAADEHRGFLDRQHALAEEIYALENSHDDAARADVEAYSVAMRKGDPDPGQPNTTALQTDLDAKRREYAALTFTADAARTDLEALITKNLGALRTNALDDRRNAANRVAQLVDELAQAVDDCRTAGGRYLFFERYAPGESNVFKPTGDRLPNLPRQSGDPYHLSSVLAAITDWAKRTTTDPTQPSPTYFSTAAELPAVNAA